MSRLRKFRRTPFQNAFEKEASPNIRRLSDDELVVAMSQQMKWTPYFIKLQSEQRRRESWTTPAARSLWISLLALVVAVAALGFSIATQMQHGPN